ncbi:MAG: RNA-binding S4 domain-containing protein [Gemmatimonadota bacterium]
MSSDDRVRLDKWLWAARFFKTRSTATREIDLGRIRVDGERVKPAHAVRCGERIEIQLATQRIEVFVRALATVRGPAPVARGLYEETAASADRRARVAERDRYAAEPAAAIKGRPTKREGRALRGLRGV